MNRVTVNGKELGPVRTAVVSVLAIPSVVVVALGAVAFSVVLLVAGVLLLPALAVALLVAR
jgi:hypothetical protein